MFNNLFDEAQQIDNLYLINAGKFRRYHGQNIFSHFFDPKTILLNIRDIFRLLFGIVDSFILLIRIRPSVIFIKGGYVGVPVGLVARILRMPYITHDSDAHPGLTNRLIGRRAIVNAVGMLPEYYKYKKEKISFVGVPIADDFTENHQDIRRKKRRDLDLTQHDFLLLITGGSNGAKRMDKIVHTVLEKLISKNPRLHIVHQVGKDNEEIYGNYPAHLHSNIRVASFLQPLSDFIAAADAIISRAGATAISEVGIMKKPLIIIPNPYLSGGHQLKNAESFEKDHSAIVVNEHDALENPKFLAQQIQRLIDDPDLRSKLSDKLSKRTKKNASKTIANLLIIEANKRKK